MSPILLIGDSFSYQYRAEGADLASQLFARLGYSIDTISVSGGGKDAIWQALAQREGDLSEKRVVIWCFSGLVLYQAGMERYDLFPNDDEVTAEQLADYLNGLDDFANAGLVAQDVGGYLHLVGAQGGAQSFEVTGGTAAGRGQRP